MKPLVWVHADCMRRDAPFWAPHPNSPAVFVFDDRQLQEDEWTLKRVAFLYECLLELPVDILRGDTVEQLLAAMKQHACNSIVTAESPDPRIQAIVESLKKRTFVEVVEDVPFVDLHGPVDLRRFSRYWQKAQVKLFPQ
ncbi:MAG: hypothetical protein JNL98_28225 [Bryobacterales bacterium]|nr:hypothetical protein [Bryobacterales bacterium]